MRNKINVANPVDKGLRAYFGWRIYRVGLSWYVFDGPNWFHKHFTTLGAARTWIKGAR